MQPISSKFHSPLLLFQIFVLFTQVLTSAPKLIGTHMKNWILNGDSMESQHKRLFSKLIFAATFAICCNHIYLFFLRIIYRMYVRIDDFIFFDHFFYSNQIPLMLGFFYFIIYNLTPHVLWKHITSHICYSSMLLTFVS